MGWGDEIMVTGIARRMQEKDKAPVRVNDKRGRTRWSEIWNGNPRLARPDFKGRVQVVVNGPGRRPYIDRETASRWHWRDWICPVGEIYLDGDERAFAARHAGKVIIEPRLKAEASRNKDWGRERWSALAQALQRHGHAVAQFGTADGDGLSGVETIRCGSFRRACAVLGRARLAVLPEGGLHHAAAALGTPTIVLFGGYISPRQTGYPHQLNLFTGGTPCGMRSRCAHCQRAMRRIGVDEVVAKSLLLIAASAPAPD